MKPIYLDYASTTPVDPRVVEKMQDCLTFEGDFGNAGSRSHSFGWKAEELVEEARLNVANLVSCDFTYFFNIIDDTYFIIDMH